MNMQNLISLNLADDSITDEGISKLAASSVMSSLEELILYGNNDITSESLIMLAESKWTKKLKKLDLHATSIDDQGTSLIYRRCRLLRSFSKRIQIAITQRVYELETNQ
jgi:hypothetical protein